MRKFIKYETIILLQAIHFDNKSYIKVYSINIFACKSISIVNIFIKYIDTLIDFLSEFTFCYSKFFSVITGFFRLVKKFFKQIFFINSNFF